MYVLIKIGGDIVILKTFYEVLLQASKSSKYSFPDGTSSARGAQQRSSVDVYPRPHKLGVSLARHEEAGELEL